MNRRYGYAEHLRGNPVRIRTRVSREVYVQSRKNALEAANDPPQQDLIAAFAAIGPAADF